MSDSSQIPEFSDLPRVDVWAVRQHFDEEKWPSVPFWSAYRPWLAAHGYTLYEISYMPELGGSVSKPRAVSAVNFTHPYASFAYDPTRSIKFNANNPLHAFAQDQLLQDVVIKLVQHGSQELAVYRALLGCPELLKSESFASVMPPIRILPSPHNFSFVVMPRWGILNWGLTFSSVQESFQFISSLLQGLSFLHSQRIVHRDIKRSNILINHFDHNNSFNYDPQRRREHVASGRARYCLFDFDLSVIFPVGSSPEDCRLDSTLSTWGAPWHHPMDTEQGEFDYDPFAYDVACMGNMLAEGFDCLTPMLPLLAPLFDRMTTHVIGRRFTASQSLDFFKFIERNASPEELDTPLPPKSDKKPSNRWEGLPPDFVATWSTYRETSPKWSIRILRWIGRSGWGWRLLTSVRRTLRI